MKKSVDVIRLNFEVPSPYKEMLDEIATSTLRTRPNAILTLIVEEHARRHPTKSNQGAESGAASIQAAGLNRG